MIDPQWLPRLAANSPLLHSSGPMDDPPPYFDQKHDCLRCYVQCTFGPHFWKLPLQSKEKLPASYPPRYRWFARLLLEGSVLPQLAVLRPHLRNSPKEITLGKGSAAARRIIDLVRPLEVDGIDCASALARRWCADALFLKKPLQSWIRKGEQWRLKKLWGTLMAWAQAVGSV